MRALRPTAVLIALAVLTAAACGDDGAPPAAADLEGRRFLSQEVQGRDLVPGTRIDLSFAGGELRAHAGCNHLFGAFELRHGRLLVSELGQTEIGCPEELHEQDDWLARLLSEEPEVRVDGDQLVLVGTGGRVVLVDRRIAEPDLPLVGTTWRLDALIHDEVVSSVPAGVPTPTLEIDEDGGVRLFGGCNRGEGTAIVDGGRLVVTVAVTDVACAAEVMAIEEVFLAVVTSPDLTATVEARRLSLRAGSAGLDLLSPDR